MIYYLYSIRSQGWLTKGSTYSSDVRDAKAFDRDDALAMCRRQKERGSHKVIPVRAEDLE